jgi:hypothetical protein
VAAGTLAALAPGQAGGQRLVARGDALLRRGDVGGAESMYYAAAARAPRDPAARLALGRYLAARGALRVGAVLLEEARFFGADTAVVARELAPVYGRLADYAALAALHRSPLGRAERDRAGWLRDHPPAVEGADSVTVALGAPPGDGTVGTFRATVGTDTLTVAVDPGITGWLFAAPIDGAGTLRRFGSTDARGAPAVADVRIGGLALTRVAVRLAPAGSRAAAPGSERRASGRRGRRSRGGASGPAPTVAARVGLDALGALAPTFDPAAGVLTLRRDGRVRRVRGERTPLLLLGDSAYVPADGRLVGLARATGGTLLPPGSRWTYDRRRGEIVVER